MLASSQISGLCLLYEGAHSSIYLRGNSHDNAHVLLKVLNTPHPTPRQLACFNNEYELMKHLDAPGVRRVEQKTTIEGRPALVMEYVPGAPLKEFIRDQCLTLLQQLHLAIGLSQALQAVHAAQIIHKDLNSNNVLVTETVEGPQAVLIDFGIASQLDIKLQHLGHPDALEGTLAYISPEQTGRMNRVVDYRTDLYSLGVTLYELFSGQLPFDAEDAMELAHCHIARRPEPPHLMNPQVPEILSAIVMKLMEKNAEDRYQSAYGVKVDLEKCLTLAQKDLSGFQSLTGLPFDLAQDDISARFQVPQKLYGREREIQRLLDAFERIAPPEPAEKYQQSRIGERQVGLMLLGGYSGVGKSSLVHEIHKPITGKRGYFISGKFDQYQRNVPYYAMRQAFDEFAAYLLTEDDERLQAWKTRILDAVGNNGQLLIEIAPKLKVVLGDQPDVEKVGPQEAQNRLNMVFQNFVSVIARPEHPLVLFLDDLQWADAASLHFLRTLLSDPDIRHCLIICAYRDNETDASHPFMMTVEDVKKGGMPVEQIMLGNLSAESLNTLLAETFKSEPDSVLPLSSLLYRKTYGNAFFSIRLLQELFEEGLIRFDHQQRRWSWDNQQIQDKQVSDNVVELVTRKIEKLSRATQRMLQLASCIGNQFDLDMLSVISETSHPETLAQLWEALQEGLIVPLDEQYKQVKFGERHAGFTFLHDRVQQGVYTVIDSAEQEHIHLRIGQLLLKHTSPDDLEELMFDIVQQLNQAAGLLNDAEREQLIDLNVKAGRKAKAGAAYSAALDFFFYAERLCEQDAWTLHQARTFTLYREKAECLYLTGDYEQSQTLLTLLLKKAQSREQQLEVYAIEVRLYETLARFADAIRSVQQALKLLNVHIPEDKEAIQRVFQAELAEVLERLHSKSLEELFALPEANDESILTTARFLSMLQGNAINTGRFPLLFLGCLKLVKLTLKEGNNIFSSQGYTLFSTICIIVLKDYPRAYEMGALGMRLADRYGNFFLRCIVGLTNAAAAYPLGEHLKRSTELLRQAIRDGMESGNVVFWGYSYIHLAANALIMGSSLERLREEFQGYLSTLKRLKNQPMFDIVQAAGLQAVLNLRGEIAAETFDCADFSEQQYKATYGGIPLWIAQFAISKLRSLYLFGNYAEAFDFAGRTENTIVENLGGQIVKVAEFSFYRALTYIQMTAQCDSEEDRSQLLESVALDLRQMNLLAESCPENFLHKSLLMEAERHRISGGDGMAMDFYEQAIHAAQESGYVNHEALAYELAAQFYLGKKIDRIARVYLQEARYAYQRWGATAKVAQLEEKFPQQFGGEAHGASHQAGTTVTTTMMSGVAGSSLDMQTVVKASQALSQEVRLDRVLSRMMQLVLENAGAQQGALLLKEDGELRIQARGGDDSSINVLQAMPLKDSQHQLPVGIVEFAARSEESVVLADAARDERFGRDEYVQRTQPKSVLCQPLVHKGVLTGVLYLENSLTPNAFTPNRLELLNVLCAQAAISLENAKLVENMRGQERLQQEMELARRIQTAILPRDMAHPDFDIAAAMLPAEEVGGDYYDVLYDEEGHLWLGIGDVSGHGVTPGLIMMMAQTIKTTVVNSQNCSPKEVVNIVNKILFKNVSERLEADHFMTFSTLKYLGAGCFQHAGAHLDLIVHRQAANTCELIDTDGAWLNFIPDISHATHNAEFTLEIGDTLVLYTDGLTEAHVPGGELLDLPRFIEIVRTHAEKSPAEMRDAILEDVLVWCEQFRADDMSLMVIRRKS